MFDLSIVLLVWHDRAFLRACLDSIAAAQQDLAVEIVLVENGVVLDASEYVTDEHLSLRVIRNVTNRGVAPARNQGLEGAQGSYVMTLDVDTVVTQDALVTLVRFMDANVHVGLAGPRLQDAAGNLQYTCRRLPTVWSKVLRRIPTQWAQDALADEMLMTYDHRTPRAVDYVIGACQMIRRTALEQVGWLDEQFFYGPEDVDYCVRMWKGGWQVMYVPDAVVVHNEQRLTKRSTFSKLSVIHAVNLARYFWKWGYWVRRPRVMDELTPSQPSPW